MWLLPWQLDATPWPMSSPPLLLNAMRWLLNVMLSWSNALHSRNGEASETKLAEASVRQASLEQQLLNSQSRQRELAEALIAVAKDDEVLAGVEDTVELAVAVDEVSSADSAGVSVIDVDPDLAVEQDKPASVADEAEIAAIGVRSYAVVAALGERRSALARELESNKEELEAAKFEVTKVGQDLAKLSEELDRVRAKADVAERELFCCQ